jgi:muconolactone delta-isomerase
VNLLDGIMADVQGEGKVAPARLAALALDGLEVGLTEILADDPSRTVQQGLAGAPAFPSPPPKTRSIIMDYLVEFITTTPDDAPPPEIEQRLAGETTRVAELAAQGHALRVWKPLPEDGRQRAFGLYRAGSDEELAAILDSLPLRPWMEISVTALAEHPNDPARSAA